MEWLLLTLIFSGPTSPDHIEAKRFPTEQACREAERERLGRVCIPVAPLSATANND